MKALLLTLCILLFSITVNAETIQVQRIVDGDTLITTQGEKIRLYGIDAPEMPTKSGKKSKAFLKEILPPKSHAVIIRINKDQYKRTLAILIFNENVINRTLVKQKYARVIPKYCKIQACKEWKRSK